MKINGDITSSETSRLYRANKTTEPSGGPSFSDLLSQAVAGDASAQDSAPAGAVSSAAASSASLAAPPLLAQTSGLVDALDSYGAALANPNLTLKQVEPLANNLEQQAEQLAGALPPGDEEPLNSLAWLAVNQARAEVLKFRRGDYV